MPKSKKSKDNADHTIAEAVLRLLARKGWDRVSVDEVARAAKIRTTTMSKDDLLPLIIRFIDSRMEAGVGDFDSRSNPHDRLFETLMARFDALQAHRRAILSLMDAARRNPALVRIILPAQIGSMQTILRLTELTPERKRIQPFVVAGLLGIYGYALCIWRTDSSQDMATTMAALDRSLRRAASIADILLRRK